MSGLFGVVSRTDCSDTLYYGTDYQSHLGTEFGGLAIQGDRLHRAIHRIARGQFKNLFDDFHHNYSGNMGVGVISDSDPQPIVLGGRHGTSTLVTSGLITNCPELADQLISQGITFSEIEDGKLNQTEVVAKLIAQGDTIVEGINHVFDRIEGSLSLLIMNDTGIYAACDPAGRVPLSVARGQGMMVAASETCSFPNLGLETTRHLQSGEVLFFDAGEVTEEAAPVKEGRICSFMWIYTGYPASVYRGISTESVRERCGAALARRDADMDFDLASGVPDSGTGHAVGYAIESGKPFRRPLVKYTAGYGRSYIPPSQDVRDRIAKMKLIPIQDIIEGNRLVVCEDSIVRGTQLKNLTVKKLWDAGADEIHVRVACPPLMFPCPYMLSTRSVEELAARRAIRDLEGGEVDDLSAYLDESSEEYGQMVDWIRQDINCTSLKYQRLDDMLEAIGRPCDELCTHCWAGGGD
ncbi:MAG: amidophosphoribosyltransferase [Planctomycetota bacterium]